MTADVEGLSLARVGGVQHETLHRAEHCSLYLPLFRRAFGDETTWGDKHALIMFAGRGREAEFFTPFCRHVTLVDNYGPCVEVLRRRFEAADRPYVAVVQNNGVDLSGIPDGSVDILTALIALMHIRPTHMRVSYAREFNRVLSPRGKALLQLAQNHTATPWEDEVGPEVEYQVGTDMTNVGFIDEAALRRWWERYLRLDFVQYGDCIPGDGTMKNWWWVGASKWA
jgi:SAM-dependent methyltransferase